MKSLKPNDPRRLTITGFGQPKAKSGTIRIPVHVEYEPWCCTEAHEYANAFKAVSDLFDESADDKARLEYVATQLEWISDNINTDTLDKDQAIEILQSVAQYLREQNKDVD